MNNVQLRVGDLLYAAFKRWKMILALGLLGFICGFALSGVSYLQGNYTSYEISCSIAITSQSSTGAFTNNSSYLSTNDFHLAEDMVDAASFVMKSNRVLQAALDSTGLVSVSTKDVYQNLEVSRYNETQVLQLTLSWNNADAGIRLMNAILDASRTILPETLMVGSVAVIDAPEAKYLMGGGSYASLWIIFSLLGLMAGVGMAVLELLMRPTLVNLKDVEDVLGLETLGNVPKDDGYFQKNTQLLSEKHRSDAEAVQNFASAAYILTNRFGTKEKQHRFYVTSAEDGEGKSTVAANLALQLSDMEKRTLLLDLNTRAPSLGGMFLRSVDYSRTLNALYKGESAAQEAIVSLTGFLDLLPMVLERNAVPLDGTLFELLEKIMEPYEYVVIDASSVGRSSDVLRLNKLANNVLFVVRYDATPLPALQDAIEKLDKSGVRVLGCVVNETQSLGTFQFYPERTAVSNTPKKNENTDEKETSGSLPEDLLRPADGQEKAADWKPSGAGSQSVLDELTDDLYQTKGGLSDNEAMWELLRMGKDATLTGRTELWNGIYKFMQQHNMLTGYGYGQFWMNKSNVKKLHLMYNHKSYFSRMSTGAHNQIMELWLNIGLFGIASYFLAIVGSMRYAKNMKLNEYMRVSSLFFYLMLCGLTERIFENAYAYRVVMFFILLAVACNHIPDRKQLRRRKNDEREASHHGGRADL